MDDRIVQIARKTLEVGDKILIVGVTPGNLGKWYGIDDHRLVFWSSASRQTTRRVFPVGVGLVVVTRFMCHTTTEWLRSSLPKMATFYTKHVSTGELKDLLETVYTPLPKLVVDQREEIVFTRHHQPVLLQPAVSNVSLIREEQMPSRSGVTDFVKKEADLAADKPSVEIVRLAQLATEAGLSTTSGSISHAFFAAKARRKVSVPSTNSRRDSGEMLKRFASDCDLARVAIAEVLDENVRLQQEVRSLKAALVGQKQAIKKALSQL